MAGGSGPGADLAFVIGAPRSGTTWLSQVLGAHPDVAATYETHLFNAYLAGPVRAWRTHLDQLGGEAERYRATGEPPRATIGLPYVVTDEEYRRLLSALVDGLTERVLAAKPGASVVVEKTPAHSSYLAEIEYATGGRARYVHLVRDGYDVVDSLQRAAAGWGAAWAPRDTRSAAKRWLRGVTGAREAAAYGARYLEVRYEDLVADPAACATEVFGFLGVASTPEVVGPTLGATAADLVLGGEAARVLGTHPPEPSGFRRGERTAGIGDREVAVVNGVARDLLAELGYLREPDAGRVADAWWRASGAVAEGRTRLRRAGTRLRATR